MRERMVTMAFASCMIFDQKSGKRIGCVALQLDFSLSIHWFYELMNSHRALQASYSSHRQSVQRILSNDMVLILLPCTVLYQCNWKLPSWIRSCQVSKANIYLWRKNQSHQVDREFCRREQKSQITNHKSQTPYLHLVKLCELKLLESFGVMNMARGCLKMSEGRQGVRQTECVDRKTQHRLLFQR